MKTTVIHHSADFDGHFCREIARKFLPSDTEFIGWDYGQPLISMPSEGDVYILDLSPECLSDVPAHTERIIWIDHHKSAIEKFNPGIIGYRIDGVAACRLAWQWFVTWRANGMGTRGSVETYTLPSKQDYIDRLVSEPPAVRLAGEYDIWDKRDSDAEVLQFGLRADKNLDWDALLAPSTGLYLDSLLSKGHLLQKFQQEKDAYTVNAYGFLTDFEGVKFLALNSPSKSSLQFAAKDVPETGHEALLKFSWTGKVWDVSLYHAKHRTDLDLSLIAVKHGGGGHRGACGFRAEKLPFLP